MLCEDVDDLAVKLDNSPFVRLGGPRDLYSRPRSPRAMQLIGPSGELIYITRMLPHSSVYAMKPAKSEVDRPFILAVASPSIEEMQAFYGGVLGMRCFEPFTYYNGILANMAGVPSDTTFRSAITPIPGRKYLIEIDHFPPNTGPRQIRPGHLPPGMAMITCESQDFDSFPVDHQGAIRSIDDKPYAGRRSMLITGPAGEWLEIVEPPIAA